MRFGANYNETPTLSKWVFHIFNLVGFLSYDAFFLEGADSLGAKLHGDFFAVNHKSFGLEVWLPDFLGMALAEAHIVAILLAFTG